MQYPIEYEGYKITNVKRDVVDYRGKINPPPLPSRSSMFGRLKRRDWQAPIAEVTVQFDDGHEETFESSWIKHGTGWIRDRVQPEGLRYEVDRDLMLHLRIKDYMRDRKLGN